MSPLQWTRWGRTELWTKLGLILKSNSQTFNSSILLWIIPITLLMQLLQRFARGLDTKLQDPYITRMKITCVKSRCYLKKILHIHVHFCSSPTWDQNWPQVLFEDPGVTCFSSCDGHTFCVWHFKMSNVPLELLNVSSWWGYLTWQHHFWLPLLF